MELGFSEFEKEEHIYYDLSIIDYIEEETYTSFKTEEINKTIEHIINRKFTELNIQDEVDDMIIECITDLGLTYEETYNKLQEYYNLPLVENISQGKTMLSDFYKKNKKRPKMEWSAPNTSTEDSIGREIWSQPTWKHVIIRKQKPQLWMDEILSWEQVVVRMWETNRKDSMDMFAYLETTALGIWQSKKAQDPDEINKLKALGDNPYNFTSQIRTLILEVGPAKNNTLIQDTTIRNLEQLSIADMKYINEFILDFTRLLSQTGQAMDDNLCDKYFIKLPGDLGRYIHETWKQQYGEQKNLGIGPRITYTFTILEDKCKEVALQEQLKKNAYAFCKSVI
uniref:Uncharacterized protein n=1 Tax=Lactuca sativa TaxID=4236 RepID=A0A9R1WL48_LACSA|nr:hypothetical protein LSAT_V11C100030830 [Lactuca sativa]